MESDTRGHYYPLNCQGLEYFGQLKWVPVYVLRGHYELFHILLCVVRSKAHFYEPTIEEKQQREADAQAAIARQQQR